VSKWISVAAFRHSVGSRIVLVVGASRWRVAFFSRFEQQLGVLVRRLRRFAWRLAFFWRFEPRLGAPVRTAAALRGAGVGVKAPAYQVFFRSTAGGFLGRIRTDVRHGRIDD
jgi:hypothetical protein